MDEKEQPKQEEEETKPGHYSLVCEPGKMGLVMTEEDEDGRVQQA